MQGQVGKLRQHLNELASTSAAAVDEAALAGSTGFSSALDQLAAFHRGAKQAAQGASVQLDATFSSLSQSFEAQRAQLNTFAHEQQVPCRHHLRDLEPDSLG